MYAFIDESGDHNMNLALSDNTYNIFVLGAVFIDKDDYETVDRDFKAFKKGFFGSEDFITHTDELTHPLGLKSDPRNGVMRNPEKRAEFYNWANDFIDKAPIRAVFTVVQKVPFFHKYRYPADPYHLSFENILNRTLYYSKSDNISILPECRNSHADKKIEAEFAKYSVSGTTFHTADTLQKRIREFRCVPKKDNSTGLQLADLLVTPVGRHFNGAKPKPSGNEITYETIRRNLAGNEKISITVIP